MQVTSNNVATLPVGKAQYTCFPNEEEVLLMTCWYITMNPKILVAVNAANIEKDWNWCVSHNTVSAELENASDHMAIAIIQGPERLWKFCKTDSVDLSEIPIMLLPQVSSPVRKM